MATSYFELADAVFNKIKDYDFLSMKDSEAYEVVLTYLKPATIKFRGCHQDLSDRDETIKSFNFTLTDQNFEILVNYMVMEWLTSNYILTGHMLKPRMTSTDFKSLGIKDMLAKVTELRNILMKENDQLMIDDSYGDSMIYKIAITGGDPIV